MALFRFGKWVLPATVVAIALGMLISIQYQAQKKVEEARASNLEKIQAVRQMVEKAKEQKEALLEQQRELLQKVEAYRNQPGQVSPNLKAQIDDIGIFSGETPVEGPGIHIEIDDRKVVSPLIITDQFSQLVNILRYAGAEAISVNGQRIGARSFIASSGPSGVLVNGIPIARVDGTHWEVEAIGNQDVLKSYVQTVIDPLTADTAYPELKITVNLQTVKIPAVKTLDNFSYAKPAS